jgi:hypothetical protein
VVAILAGAEIVTDTAADVDEAKFVSPEYSAEIECAPTTRLDVTNAADPEGFNDALPICVEPSRNATVPAGTPDPDFGATVAVNVIASPDVAWVDDAESEVVVATGAEASGMKTKTVAEYAGKLKFTVSDTTATGAPATICAKFALLYVYTAAVALELKFATVRLV